MNSSLYTLDRATHLKIILVAVITAAVVLIIGESAQVGRSMPTTATRAAIAMPAADATWAVGPAEIHGRIPG